MGPDYRVIVKHARHEAAAYKQRYGEDIPTEQLVQTVAEIFQVWPYSPCSFVIDFSFRTTLNKEVFVYLEFRSW